MSARRVGVLSRAGARARFDALADRRRDADRLRLPGEDDAGVPRRAGLRARLRGRRAYDGASADRAAACRRRRDDRERGLVGRDRRPVARIVAADDRRLVGQQHPQPDRRLQRLGASHRQRWWPRRRWRRRGQLQRRDRRSAAVQRPDGRAGVVAAAGGAARAGGRAGVALARAPHGPHPRRTDVVGQLARRQRPRVQPQRRRHSHVLHRGARAGDRRARGDRRRGRVAQARAVRCPGASRARGRRDRRLVDRAARPHALVGAVARAAGRGRGRRRGARAPDAGTSDTAPDRGHGRRRARGLPRGAGCLLRADDRDGPHRIDAVGGTRELERRRPWRRVRARRLRIRRPRIRRQDPPARDPGAKRPAARSSPR